MDDNARRHRLAVTLAAMIVFATVLLLVDAYLPAAVAWWPLS